MRVPLLLLAALAAVIAHAVSGLPLQVRFSYAPLNYWLAATLALLLPVMVLWVALSKACRAHRVAGIVASVVVAVPSFAFAALAWLVSPEITNNVDPSFELLSEGRSGFSNYRLYRTNCGATCDYGLELRQEYDSPIGVKLVTALWSLYHESEGAVEVEGSTVRVVSGAKVLVTIEP